MSLHSERPLPRDTVCNLPGVTEKWGDKRLYLKDITLPSLGPLLGHSIFSSAVMCIQTVWKGDSLWGCVCC